MKRDPWKSRMVPLWHLRTWLGPGLNGESVKYNGKGRVGGEKTWALREPSEACRRSTLARRVYCCSSPKTLSMPLTARLWRRTGAFHLHFYSILVRKPRSQPSAFLHCWPRLHLPCRASEVVGGRVERERSCCLRSQSSDELSLKVVAMMSVYEPMPSFSRSGSSIIDISW